VNDNNSTNVSIVVINLDRDADRMAYMKQQLDALGLKFERFSGVLGSDLPASVRDYFPDEDGSGFLSNGEIGCYASHLSVYQAITDGRITAPVLVLEDDVLLGRDLKELLQEVLRKLPEGWDMVRFSSPAKRAYFAVAKVGDAHTLAQYSNSPGSNGAILVSKSGAEKFLKRIPRSLPIDQDNKRVWAFDLNLYGIVPEPIKGNSLGNSTIDDLSSGECRPDRSRQRELRRKRQFSRRHAWNIRAFGAAGWFASEALSFLTPLLPRAHRPAFLDAMAWRLRGIALANNGSTAAGSEARNTMLLRTDTPTPPLNLDQSRLS
jgi:glycosyl transferase, family 25